MRNIEVVEHINIHTLYYFNTATASISVSPNEEESAIVVMTLLKTAQKDKEVDASQFFNSALIIEVSDELVKCKEGEKIIFEYIGPKYYLWNYDNNVYPGQPGFKINEVNIEDVVSKLNEKGLARQFSKISRKLASLQVKGVTFKKVRNLFQRLKLIYFIIYEDYYDKFTIY